MTPQHTILAGVVALTCLLVLILLWYVLVTLWVEARIDRNVKKIVLEQERQSEMLEKIMKMV